MKSRLLLAAAAAALLAPAYATPAAAEIMVLRSIGPSAKLYPPGRRLPDSASFTLKNRDLVAILTRRGTRVFQGRGTFTATGPVAANRLTSAEARSILGVTRGGEGEPGPVPPDLWHYDVSEGGALCIPAGARPRLWRPASWRSQVLTIRPARGGARLELPLRVGQGSLDWPAELPVTAEARYVLTLSGAPRPAKIVLKPLAVAPGAPTPQLADALLAAGCTSQLDHLIATSLEP
jgi:hypothetical protein